MRYEARFCHVASGGGTVCRVLASSPAAGLSPSFQCNHHAGNKTCGDESAQGKEEPNVRSWSERRRCCLLEARFESIAPCAL